MKSYPDGMSLPTWPQGFFACASRWEIKSKGYDFACVATREKTASHAMFTRNTFCGAPVTVGRNWIREGDLSGVAVISGNANVATGTQGLDDVAEWMASLQKILGFSGSTRLLPSCTGIIGVPLPMEKVKKGLENLPPPQDWSSAVEDVARAIMTTDTRPKFGSRKLGSVTLTGVAKGSGMIAPNMATMLAYFFTDAKLSREAVQTSLQIAVDQSFNRISVDADTSTSDTVALFANGLAGEVDPHAFQEALNELATELALEVIRDGEGATRIIEAKVIGAANSEQAQKIARSVVDSPLVKTAVHGADANWGRVAMAAGKTFEAFDPHRLDIAFGDFQVLLGGQPISFDEESLEKWMASSPRIPITLDLHQGNAEATFWGCDLSHGYIDINALYRT